ncbi:MAG: hypothetical protein WC998_00690 [Candidatus Paceibacterota bacterium]|jgi:hypothetical protein
MQQEFTETSKLDYTTYEEFGVVKVDQDQYFTTQGIAVRIWNKLLEQTTLEAGDEVTMTITIKKKEK